jgi:hypothetical protein
MQFNFVNKWTASDSWEDFTNQATVTFPKNLVYRDKHGKLQRLKGDNVNAGGFSSTEPLFLKGDKITIEAGYKYRDRQGNYRTKTEQFFTGYIVKVGSGTPFTIECEDNMYLLKQIPAPTKCYPATMTVEDIMKDIINPTAAPPQYQNYVFDISVNALTKTTIGQFLTQSETAMQILARIRKDYGFEAYFKGNELRIGSYIYIESEAKERTFSFQGFYDGIFESELDYQRTDDLVLSAVAHNDITEQTGSNTKDGQPKTKSKKLQVLVTIKDDVTTIKEIQPGQSVPDNTEGQRNDYHFPGAKTIPELAKLAEDKLRLLYYNGMKGNIAVLGLPIVRQGDNVTVKSQLLPEQNGKYKVKKVEYSGGVDGIRQKIYTHYKLQ